MVKQREKRRSGRGGSEDWERGGLWCLLPLLPPLLVERGAGSIGMPRLYSAARPGSSVGRAGD